MDTNASPHQPPEQESIGSLLSGLIGDLQSLIRGEVELAKTELREEAQSAARGATFLAVAAILALVGLILLMFGVATYLMRWLDDWQAFGLVGLVLLAVAAIVGYLGKRRLSAATLTPERTIASLKEDKEWASQQVKSRRN